MPKLMIDNREVDVLPGTKIIEAAAQLGIIIPRFCYHPGLGSVGACRVCAVKVLEGPPRTTGIQMSCMLDAADDMVVSTTDAEAVDFRRHIIEFLMLNHPHDCPVCDEGGHCLLQDMTVSGGHGIRRFKGKKRTHRDQYLGPLVEHEMNRCIQCYRCVRFYREFTGYTDLGVMGIGSRVYYGRQTEGILKSPFSGNLVDICPTGVFTDKPSRYRGRRWDFERTPSICIHCSLGCHTVVCSRYREVVRQEARFSPQVNGYFICDRGRHGFYYASAKDRPRKALVDHHEVPMAAAAEEARKRLDLFGNSHGPSAVACIGSIRSSLESQGVLKSVCKHFGWQGPFFFKNGKEAACTAAAASGIGKGYAVSMERLAQADLIIVLGADPINEAPMAALAMRQAVRTGAAVMVLDPRPVNLPMPFSHIPLAPAQIGSVFEAALSAAQTAFHPASPVANDDPNERTDDEVHDDVYKDAVEKVRDAIAQSLRPVIMCGTDIVPPELPAAAANGAAHLSTSNKAAGLFYLLPGPNAIGASLFTENAHALDGVVEDIEEGRVGALVVVENDIFHGYPDTARLEKALNGLELLVVVDYLNQPLLGRADVFLPSATVYESGGIFVNQEGRAQEISRAFHGGIPLSQITGGGHPPREFTTEIPEGDPSPAWAVLAQITGKGAGTGALPKDLYPALSILDACGPFPLEGVRLDKSLGQMPRIDLPPTSGASHLEDGIAVIMVDQTFGTEELSARSPCLQELASAHYATMHANDAAEMGLADGDTIVIEGTSNEGTSNEGTSKEDTTKEGGSERLTISLRTVENMAAGIMLIPRHYRISRRLMPGGSGIIEKKRIKKG